MARVTLTGNLRQFVPHPELEIEARNVRELIRALSARYPDLAPHLEEGIAVAIDGEIFQDAWFADIPPDSEVHLMPRIAGGAG